MNKDFTEANNPRLAIPKRRLVLICLILFFFAVGVRLLVWQNTKSDIERVMSGVTQPYQADAKTLLAGDLTKFISGADPPVDASILAHPPGYPILIAAVYGIFGYDDDTFRIVQFLLNSLAAIVALFIALRLFDIRTAVIAAFLMAMSPQIAYYSSIILPDELSAVLILAGLYFFVRTVQDKNFWSAVFCGVCLGLSCWLRSNALLLPLFFAGTAFIVLPKNFRLKFAAVLLASFLLVLSPITIRNCVVFRAFIPVSLGIGTTFVEGLGDYDSVKRLGMPSTDEGVMEMDARNAGRPDYYGNLYNPDGIERERERIKIGLSLVAANPGWYLASVLHRGMMTFRMERVPVIAPQQAPNILENPIPYYINLPLKLFQKLFITAIFVPLFLFAVVIMLRTKEPRVKLALLAVVPIY